MGKSKKKSKQHKSRFDLEGRFLRYLVKEDFKIKGLQLATAEGEYTIKLSKQARASIAGVLAPGDWIQVSGEEKCLKSGSTKLEAAQITIAAPNRSETFPQPEVKAGKSKSAPKVLVCQKSPCRKRGASGVCQMLETTLGDRGLGEQVAVKQTGCMNRCKAGPNVVFMPGKTRYSGVSPDQIPDLVEKHLSNDSNLTPESAKPSAEVAQSQ